MFHTDFSSLKAAAPSDSRAEMGSHADTKAPWSQLSLLCGPKPAPFQATECGEVRVTSSPRTKTCPWGLGVTAVWRETATIGIAWIVVS